MVSKALWGIGASGGLVVFGDVDSAFLGPSRFRGFIDCILG